MVQLGDQVAIVGRVAQRLPADAGLIEVMDAKQLETAQDITGLLDTLGRFIWFVPLAFAALAIWLAGDRRRSIVRSLAIGAIIAGTLVLVARSVAGNYLVDNLVKSDSVRPAASDTWEILTALLRDGARTLVGVGLVLLIGVWLVGPGARATAIRRRLAPWLERPEIAYGAAALALVLLVWWGPTAQTHRWQVVLLFAVMLGLGVAALARAAKADEAADLRPRQTGMCPATRVPRPVLESIRIDPPTAESRSARFERPVPGIDPRRLEPQPVVLDAELQLAVAVEQPDARGCARPRVLGDVLQRFQAAEVDGQLDGRRMSAQALVRDADRDRRPLHRRAQRGGDAILRQHLGIDPARDALQLVERLVELPLELLDDRLLLGLQLLAREAEMHAEGEEPLLGGVVEIAPDPAPLGVGGGESARLGAPELALEPSRSRRRAASPRQRRRRAPGSRRGRRRCRGRRRAGRRDGLPSTAGPRPRSVRASSPPSASRKCPAAGSQ